MSTEVETHPMGGSSIHLIGLGDENAKLAGNIGQCVLNLRIS